MRFILELCIVRAKVKYSFDFRLYFAGDESVSFVCKLHFIFVLYVAKLYRIYSKLRLYLYLIVRVISPSFWMNICIMGVLIVERKINVFG